MSECDHCTALKACHEIIKRGAKYQDDPYQMAETAHDLVRIADVGQAGVSPSSRPSLTYLASPYSHPDTHIEAARANSAARCAAAMFDRGVLVLSPIAHGRAVVRWTRDGKGDWRTWAALSLRLLAACDEVAVLTTPGWRESVGVRAEVQEALRLGLPVRYVDEVGNEVVS